MARQAELKKVPQRDAQILIWALKDHKIDFILKHPRTPDLFRPEDLAELQMKKSGQEFASSMLSKLAKQIPADIKKMMSLEKEFKDKFDSFTRGAVSYEDLEKAAVLTGDPPPHKDDINVPRGQWTLAPGGYYVRHFPHGFRNGLTEFYRPEPIVSKYDHLKRPVWVMSKSSGLRIDYEYYDDKTYAAVREYPGVRAYPFKAVKIFFPASLNNGKDVTLVSKGKGFILTGSLRRIPRNAEWRPTPPRPTMIAMAAIGDSLRPRASDTGPILAKGEDDASDSFEDKIGEALIEPHIENLAREIGGAVETGYGIAKNFMDAWETHQEIQKVMDPDLGVVDKSRAAREAMSGMVEMTEAGGGAFTIPLIMANEMIDRITDVWEQVNNALAGGESQDDPRLNNSGVLVPGKTHKQRLLLSDF